MSTLDEITKEKQRLSEALARVDAQREKLTGELSELEATERVLARYSKGTRAKKTASARTPTTVTKAAAPARPRGRSRNTSSTPAGGEHTRSFRPPSERLTLPLQQRLRARARELAVEWRDINGLVPYARNARTHSEAQIAQIAGSIREFGFTNPVLIDPEGGIFGQFTSLPASMIRPPSPTR